MVVISPPDPTRIDIREFSLNQLVQLGRDIEASTEFIKLIGLPQELKQILENHPSAKELLQTILGHSDWKMTKVEQDILAEELGLAIWDNINGLFEHSQEDLICQINLGLNPQSKNELDDCLAQVIIEYDYDMNILKLLLEKDPIILKDQDKHGETLAIWAARQDFDRALKVIIERNPRVLTTQVITPIGSVTPLTIAAQQIHTKTFNVIYNYLYFHKDLDAKSAGIIPALQLALDNHMFPESNATTRKALSEWLNNKLVRILKTHQAKEILSHFRAWASDKVEDILNLKSNPDHAFEIAKKLIASSYNPEDLLSDQQIKDVIHFALDKKTLALTELLLIKLKLTEDTFETKDSTPTRKM